MIYSFSYSHDLYIFSVVFHEISHIYNNEMKRYISYVNHTHSLCLFVIPCSFLHENINSIIFSYYIIRFLFLFIYYFMKRNE